MDILDKFPIILTKDKDWSPNSKAEPGAIIFLPDDAVLIVAPEAKEE